MGSSRSDLPAGTVTLLFTDVEGSTRLLQQLGPEGYADALAEHRRVLRGVYQGHGGVEVDTQGDAFFYAFPEVEPAVRAAAEGQEALRVGAVRVRVGVHTGQPRLTEEGYVGTDVNKAARIAAAGHGGQVLLSKETAELVDTPVLDLGEHRLKDFDEPVWIVQLSDARFPPLKTISNTNLPRPASSFVGRERELQEVLGLFRSGARLVSLTGPGGSGKTRLAFEVATELVPEHRNGVFLVDLSPLHDPVLVMETIAQTLGAKDGLADHIAEREMFLLLDNFEQVIDAAPDAAGLLEACPNLRALVTTRELLRAAGEVEYAVPPLADEEAVGLFVERSGVAVDEAVAELCRRLDNLPLAIELAAARTKVMRPEQILERLGKRLDLLKGGRGSDPRQQTLRATIEWSYDLLQENEKQLFARLAVFAGGCTLEAAEEIADADIDDLQSLVEKSLVRHDGERFSMLETVRQYAVERFEELPDRAAIEARHHDYFLDLAESREPELLQYSKDALDALEAELDNFRIALERLTVAGDSQTVMRLAGSLAELWGIRGYLVEGQRTLVASVEADDRPTPARAKALLGVGDLSIGIGHDLIAARYLTEARETYRSLGDDEGIATALMLQGGAEANAERWTEAREQVEEAIGLFTKLEDTYQTLLGERFLGWIYTETGEVERADSLYRRAVPRAREFGNAHILAQLLEGQAHILSETGQTYEAATLLKEAHALHVELDDRYRIAIMVLRFARVLTTARMFSEAAVVLSSSEIARQEIGVSQSWVVADHTKVLNTLRERLDDSELADAWERGKRMSPDEAIEFALASLRGKARS